MNRQSLSYTLGQRAEEWAAHYLQSCGAWIVAQRWRTRDGEVDLIVRQANLLIFVEVKVRSGPAFGSGAAAVDALKLHRLRRVAVAYINRYNWLGLIRIDVIDFSFSSVDHSLQWNHLRNVTL